jgi:hypothetical protein
METVEVVSEKEIPLESLRALIAPRWAVSKGSNPDRLVIEESDSRVYILHRKLDSGDIDTKTIYMNYSNADLVKEIIKVIGDDPELMIDNDFHTILPGDQFVARLRDDSNWNWQVPDR